MSPQEFAEAWGQSNLRPISPELLQKAHLRQSSKQFLSEAGLPREAKPSLVFYSAPDLLAPLPTVLSEVDLPSDFERYLLLADDGGTFLCADTQKSDAVVSVDAYQELPTRFVNSNVPAFAECLLLYRSLPDNEQVKTMTKEVLKDNLEELKTQFDNVDRSALNNPDNWWSVVIEELEIFVH